MDKTHATTEQTLTLGRYLSELREKKGMSLADLSERTKITLAQLESFEQNNLSGLPPKSFSLGFLRSLCMELNGDYNQAKQLYFILSNDVVEMYTQQRAAANKEPQPSAETREVMGRNISLSPYIFGVIVVALLVVAVYLYASDPRPQQTSAGLNIIEEVRRNSVVLDVVADDSEEVPLFPVESTDSPDAAAAVSMATPLSETRETAPVLPSVASEPAVADSRQESTIPSAPLAPPVASAVEPQPMAEEPTRHEIHAVSDAIRVVLRGKGLVWVKMVGDKGKTVRTTTLNQGGTLEILSGHEVIVSLGNAALVEVSIDGQRQEPVGTRGEVRRFIVRNDRSLEFLTRAEYLVILSALGVPE
ncbi:helix-turn-helix domain-containing protein [Chrysiogenes arsenatis]|uniref:helix-turn-helix domain-containing protein n=1 Tax=Chrysiogenes arsenatis TaxID=309797 RepID=UPI000410ABEA|nr:RodZ domain-containing protein [Chrysiogenes arsenatis]